MAVPSADRCHRTWHAVHSTHHGRTGPDGGEISRGFSSFTVTFAGLGVPCLRHSQLEYTQNNNVFLHTTSKELSRNKHGLTNGLHTHTHTWVGNIGGILCITGYIAVSYSYLLTMSANENCLTKPQMGEKRRTLGCR